MGSEPGAFAGVNGKRVLHFRESFEAGRIVSLKLLKSSWDKKRLFCLRTKTTHRVRKERKTKTEKRE